MDGGALAPGAIAAALDWWRGAGVDCDFTDDATAWLAQEPPQTANNSVPAAAAPRVLPPVAAPRAQIGGPREMWPQSLDAFGAWWLAEPSLDDGQTAARVPPRGAQGSRLMVLLEHPEADDTASLMSGKQGAMLRSLLAALGLDEHQAYFASALPRHMPLPDWSALAADGLGAVTSHHVRLVQPQRLLIFGSNVSSLLGHDPANRDGFLPDLGQDARRIPALVAPGLSALAARPRGKARLWQALLDWTGADLMGTN